jgi:phosphoribosylformylglycinamidine cyclo-ligase
VSTSHADGAGTKAVLAYLHFRETADASVFRGIAQDALVMNLDDLACVGAVDRFLLCNSIGRNAARIPAIVLHHIIHGFVDCCRRLEPFGISIVPTGGETADLGDSVRTLVVDSVLSTRMPRSQVIDAGHIVPGLVIVGLSSHRRAVYEESSNSGIGANGLTLARHVLLSPHYREQYPETVAPETPPDRTYRGTYRMNDLIPGTEMTIGQGLLSPTRTYAPVIRMLLRTFPGTVRALIHNTGGGLGKCLRFGTGIHFIKDSLADPPPIFRLIADSGVPAAEMASTFNLGYRMEIYVEPQHAQIVIEIAERFGIDAQVIGRCEPSGLGTRNHASIRTFWGDVELLGPAHG